MMTTTNAAIIKAKLKTTLAAPKVVDGVVDGVVVDGGGGAGTKEKTTAS